LENLILTEHQVDIWLIDLVGQPDEIQCYRRLLSQDEVERADRFYFESIASVLLWRGVFLPKSPSGIIMP
jgi:hypothetical protein